MTIMGEEKSVDDIISEVMKDIDFMKNQVVGSRCLAEKFLPNMSLRKLFLWRQKTRPSYRY